MNKKRQIKNTCYNWLNNFIPEPVRKNVSGFKDKVLSIFKINTRKRTVYRTGGKN